MHSARSTVASLIAIGATALALAVPVSAEAAPAARAAQATKVKVKTTVVLTGVKDNDVAHVKFTGKVKAKRPVCKKARTVKLRQVDQKLPAGKARTNKAGTWRISFNGYRIEPGTFKMTVTRKVVKKRGKRIVCKATKARVHV